MIVTATARKLLLSSRWVGRIRDKEKLERQRSEWDFLIPFYLQAVLMHSANGVKLL
jgi:hypothetical protein